LDCIETLVGLCGSEVDVADNNGSTPLFYAVTLGHTDCANLLLSFGADPNKRDKKGRRCFDRLRMTWGRPYEIVSAEKNLFTVRLKSINMY
jgi:hypothetical protein